MAPMPWNTRASPTNGYASGSYVPKPGAGHIGSSRAGAGQVQDVYKRQGFDNVMPTYQVLKAMLRAVPDLQLDRDHFMVISPDEGAMNRLSLIHISGILVLFLGTLGKILRAVNHNRPEALFTFVIKVGHIVVSKILVIYQIPLTAGILA